MVQFLIDRLLQITVTVRWYGVESWCLLLLLLVYVYSYLVSVESNAD